MDRCVKCMNFEERQSLFPSKLGHSPLSRREEKKTMVTMVTMGGDLQPGCLADRLLTGLGQPQINL
jgi:hypothetical protein